MPRNVSSGAHRRDVLLKPLREARLSNAKIEQPNLKPHHWRRLAEVKR